MKFKDYLQLITDRCGFMATPLLRYVIRRNERPTAREEAIAAKIIEAANPRENITGHYPWSAEERLVLQQLWIYSSGAEWRDVPIARADQLYTVDESGLPIPNAVRQPEVVEMDLQAKVWEMLDDA